MCNTLYCALCTVHCTLYIVEYSAGQEQVGTDWPHQDAGMAAIEVYLLPSFECAFSQSQVELEMSKE